MKVLTVVGARPQIIKASVVSDALQKATGISEVLVHTGQHHDHNMSDVFFQDLGLRLPDINLGISGGRHGEMTGRMLIALEDVIEQVLPDVMIVYGDTNSTLAGALAAAKLHIPIAHVEAGLRSFNNRMPEEINRILTDRVSRWLFAPTSEAVDNLRSEGFVEDSIYLVGDVMHDVAIVHGERAIRAGRGILDKLQISDRSFILVTIHRAENTADPSRMRAIVDGLLEIAMESVVVWPIHPRTKKVLADLALLDAVCSKMRLIDPQSYLDMVRLERAACVIATDSGGVQKEAFFHKVPCVTLREETEWVELVESGWNRIVSPQSGADIAGAIRSAVNAPGREINPYGDGSSARRIVDVLQRQANAYGLNG